MRRFFFLGEDLHLVLFPTLKCVIVKKLLDGLQLKRAKNGV